MWETITLTFLALLIEAIVGYPDRLVRAIGHPVTWMGRLIGMLDRMLNHESMNNATRRTAGTVAIDGVDVTVDLEPARDLVQVAELSLDRPEHVERRQFRRGDGLGQGNVAADLAERATPRVPVRRADRDLPAASRGDPPR